MPRYGVILPIAGHAYVEVDAADEAEAIDAAHGEVTLDNIESWESLDHITKGNVCYAPTWEAEAEEI